MSAAISEGMLEALRTAVNTSLPFTCTISTPGVTTRDAFDEETQGTPTEVTLPCGVRRPTGREVLVGGGVAEAGDAVITLPHNAVVSTRGTITRAATDDDVERVYQVKSALAGNSFPTALQVLATEIKDV